jgi:hypothetical protein
VRSTALMCGRTHSSWAFRDLFLGHISPISPHFPIRPYSKPRALSPFPHLNHSLTSKIPKPTATNLLPHHRNTTAGLSPVNPPTAGRPFGQLLIFPPFSTRNPLFQVCSFFFHFFLVDSRHKSILGLCRTVWGWFLGVFAGGWIVLKRVFKPFGFWAPTRCSRKFPNQHSPCLEAEAPLLGPLGPKA